MRRTFFLLFLACLPALAFASNDPHKKPLSYYIADTTKLDPAITDPISFFRTSYGYDHQDYSEIVSYLELLAEQSGRVSLEEMAQTYEGRPILVLKISGERNAGSLEQIREQHIRKMRAIQQGESPSADDPLICWLSYNIHGNEASSGTASVMVAYYLAASSESWVTELLNQAVVIMLPNMNPDGFQRTATWSKSYKPHTLNADSRTRQLNEAWPGGRGNHYWFDLNRDYLYVQHPESLFKVQMFQQWEPHISTDHHEMGGANSYFQPGIYSRYNPLTIDNVKDLTARMAEYHSDALDQAGRLYFSKEVFDDYFPGKGSTYPDINGGIGILFEEFRVEGVGKENAFGVDYYYAHIRNQFLVSLSTLRFGLENKADVLKNKETYYRELSRQLSDGEVKGYAYGLANDKSRLQQINAILDAHDIAVYRNRAAVTIGGKEFAPGQAFVVPLNQEQYFTIRTLFKRNTSFADSIFYDVSSWNLPMAFDIDFAEVKSEKELSRLQGEVIQRDGSEPPAFSENSPMTSVSQALFAADPSDNAFIFSYTDYYAPKLIYRLLAEGIHLRAATQPLQIETDAGVKQFNAGAVVIPASFQDRKTSGVLDILQREAAELGIDVYGVQSSRVQEGSYLGSSSYKRIQRPEILLLAGDGVSTYSAGEIWHLLDYRFNIPVTLVSPDRLSGSSFSRYNTIILPDGGYGISSGNAAYLEKALANGANVIALGRAVNALHKAGITRYELARPAYIDTTLQVPYEGMRKAIALHNIFGTQLLTLADLSHPLCYGLQDADLPVFKTTNRMAARNYDWGHAPVKFANDPYLSGYISQINLDEIKGTPYVQVQHVARGNVIAFTDNPNFRSYSYGTHKLFLNAIFFSSFIDFGSLNSQTKIHETKPFEGDLESFGKPVKLMMRD